MKYLLDTNVCIRYINGSSRAVRLKLPTIPRINVGVSVITQAELFYGSAKSQTPLKSRQKQLDFLSIIPTVNLDSSIAFAYGDVRAYLEKLGTPIGSNDLFIAATALAYDLTLVTHNTREFSRIPSLKLEDWEIN